MDSGIVTALAAIFGSAVGGLGSLSGAWITERHQDRRALLAKLMFHRETLYSDFIGESARLLVDALQNKFTEPKNLIPVYAVLGRIRLGSSRQVLTAAEVVVRNIIETYNKPNLNAEQIQAAVSGEDPLKDFSDICRTELESMKSQL